MADCTPHITCPTTFVQLINPAECLGDSLPKINYNAEILDAVTCRLSSSNIKYRFEDHNDRYFYVNNTGIVITNPDFGVNNPASVEIGADNFDTVGTADCPFFSLSGCVEYIKRNVDSRGTDITIRLTGFSQGNQVAYYNGAKIQGLDVNTLTIEGNITGAERRVVIEDSYYESGPDYYLTTGMSVLTASNISRLHGIWAINVPQLHIQNLTFRYNPEKDVNDALIADHIFIEGGRNHLLSNVEIEGTKNPAGPTESMWGTNVQNPDYLLPFILKYRVGVSVYHANLRLRDTIHLNGWINSTNTPLQSACANHAIAIGFGNLYIDNTTFRMINNPKYIGVFGLYENSTIRFGPNNSINGSFGEPHRNNFSANNHTYFRQSIGNNDLAKNDYIKPCNYIFYNFGPNTAIYLGNAGPNDNDTAGWWFPFTDTINVPIVPAISSGRQRMAFKGAQRSNPYAVAFWPYNSKAVNAAGGEGISGCTPNARGCRMYGKYAMVENVNSNALNDFYQNTMW